LFLLSFSEFLKLTLFAHTVRTSDYSYHEVGLQVQVLFDQRSVRHADKLADLDKIATGNNNVSTTGMPERMHRMGR
jgi:hypothetical protein